VLLGSDSEQGLGGCSTARALWPPKIAIAMTLKFTKPKIETQAH
jgi:hypothetical protein